MRARMMRSHFWPTSLLAGACLLGVVLLVSGCASQPAGTSAADATLTAGAAPVITVTVTPYPTATILVPPTPTSNAITAKAIAAGCFTQGDQYFENPPGPLQTTIPFPPGTLVLNQSMGISGTSGVYYFCTPGATQGSITPYMEAALPAAGWTKTSPQDCDYFFPSDDWFKGAYAIEMDFSESSLPGWALDITYLSPMGCGT